MKEDRGTLIFVILWQLGAIGTWAYLMFFDGKEYDAWWQWLLAAGLNGAIAEFWPVYWVIMKPLMWLFGWG